MFFEQDAQLEHCFCNFAGMEPILMSTLLFVPNGQTTVMTIRFYLCDRPGVWDVESNKVYLDQQLWSQWKDCRKDQRLQKKFFDKLRKVSHFSIG